MEKMFKVLVIEDDEDDFIILREMLAETGSAKFLLHWAGTYDSGLQEICRPDYDVCLLDYHLDAKNGLELLQDASLRGCEIPVIFLTAQDGYDIDVQAMGAGASDYLVKGHITADLIERSIRYSIVQKRADLELRKYRDHLEQLVEERTRELETANHRQEKLIGELREALSRIKTLRGLLPICAWCKKVRDDQGYWQQIEAYVRDHSEADFSHSICPVCAKKERETIRRLTMRERQA
ncbi:MAG: response regulator [Syntrophobacteraceae bacterium]